MFSGEISAVFGEVEVYIYLKSLATLHLEAGILARRSTSRLSCIIEYARILTLAQPPEQSLSRSPYALLTSPQPQPVYLPPPLQTYQSATSAT